MRVLGVDPGLTRCGLGVVDGLPGRRLRMVWVDVARSSADEDIDQRLLAIERHIEEALEESDDVQNVYTNFDASDEVMAQLEDDED